jgi:esterase
MTLSLSNPTIISKLIVVDIAPKTYDMSHIRQYIHWMKEIEEKVLSRQEAQQFLRERLPSEAASLAPFLLTNYTIQSSATTWHFRIPLEMIEHSLDHLQGFPSMTIYQYTRPALFIHGTRSDYLRIEVDTSLIRQLFPKAQFSSIDASHWLHAEQPQIFVNTVADFVKQHS